MTSKSPRRLLDQSCAWIRDHWNANNLDVPDAFLEQWIYNSGEEEIEPSGLHLAVFSFGYIQYDIVSNNVPPGVTRSFSASELLDLFQSWQLKLALAEIHRKTDVRTKPLPLFGFPKGEQIEAWTDAQLGN